MSNLNGFPTDNSSTTNLKYDLVASKFMTGVENHQRRTAPTASVGIVFYIIGAVLELAVALVMMVFVGLRWVLKRL